MLSGKLKGGFSGKEQYGLGYICLRLSLLVLTLTMIVEALQ
jgi:hypothetical protein